MTEILWLTEWVPPLYYQEIVCFKTFLTDSSYTEAFARVSKKGMHVILPIPSTPNGLLRAYYEISEGNRTVVPQTDSTSIFPQRFKKTQANKQPSNQLTKKRQNRMSGSSRESNPFLHLSATSSQNLQVHSSRGINTGSMHGKLQWWELSHCYLRHWRMNGNAFVYQLSTANDCFCKKACAVVA